MLEWRFRKRQKMPIKRPIWKIACRCAVTNGIPRRSFAVALVVGTILNLINQGDAIVGTAPINWLKLALTYAVPYAVSTYGAVSFYLNTVAAPDSGAGREP